MLIFFKSGNSDLWISDHYLHLNKGMRIFSVKRCTFVSATIVTINAGYCPQSVGLKLMEL